MIYWISLVKSSVRFSTQMTQTSKNGMVMYASMFKSVRFRNFILVWKGLKQSQTEQYLVPFENLCSKATVAR